LARILIRGSHTEWTEEQKMRPPEGGHQFLFGATDTTETTNQGKLNNMQDKTQKKKAKTKMQIKVHDLKPVKDAKGGYKFPGT
jgi:hypothetical protein